MRVEATPHTQAAELALKIYERVLIAVDAGSLVRRAVERVGDSVFIQGRHIDLTAFERVYIYGAGKASVEMGGALAEILGGRLNGGLVVTKSLPQVPSHLSVLLASHPVPDESSIAAGDRLLQEAAGLSEQDLAFFVLSGGASALIEAPALGITLEDIQETNRVLLASGLDIRAMNRVRSAISRIKAGGLARAFAPATVVCLVLSDVIGNDLRAIGSGPLMGEFDGARHLPEPAVPSSVIAKLPERVQDRLAHWMPQPTPPVEHFVVGSVSLAIQEAADAARALGLEPLPYGDPLKGEARDMARGICLQAERNLQSKTKPFCMIFGGETTVTIKGDGGKGGRCQEMALAAVLRLSRLPECCFLAAGTDGNDGPTDAAGAFVDALTCERSIEFGLDVRQTLRDHQSYSFLDAVGGLIKTGPTGSNVNDLVLFVRA